MDKVLESGNLEDIDALLDKLEEGVDPEAVVAAAVESGDTVVETPADNTPDQNEVVAAAPEAAPAAETPVVEEPQVVLAKDGKNHIPFSVLENERNNTAILKEQVDELTRKGALLEAQLTSADIKPKDLPENVRYTPEQIEEFESYGELGEAVGVLLQQNAALLEKVNGASSPADSAAPAVAAPDTNPFATNPDTLRWADDDSQWAMVENVNSILETDPQWSTKSAQERIPEIVRRTKLALGEKSDTEVADTAAAAVAAAQRVAPNSLTDVGGEVPGQTKSVADQLADGDTSDVEAYLAKQMAAGKSADDVLTSLLV